MMARIIILMMMRIKKINDGVKEKRRLFPERNRESIIVYWTALGYHCRHDDDNDKDYVAVHDYVIFE